MKRFLEKCLEKAMAKTTKKCLEEATKDALKKIRRIKHNGNMQT